ncbi:hypothetical protein WMY93_031153 [Mugilogobius chulae]|uniref:Protein kinase domain-containing protein n=1 Tax=Mugilogobius chulae TaxID=88201 RepID=A0AAW0MNA6_9GOBI
METSVWQILNQKCYEVPLTRAHLYPWPSVSHQAKDFISALLCVDPSSRLTADQALQHPWVSSEAPSSSCTNLHQPVSHNLRQRASRDSSRCPSTNSSGGRSSAKTRKQWRHKSTTIKS